MPIKVKGIGLVIHQSDKYALLDMYLSGDSAIAHIRQEFHLIENLKANALIGIDILGSKGINILLIEKVATIYNCCNIRIPIAIKLKGTRQIEKGVFSSKLIMIPSSTRAIVEIHRRKQKPLQELLPVDQDFLFEPNTSAINALVYAYVVDHEVTGIQVNNNIIINITISKDIQIGTIIEYEANGCFLINPENAPLAVIPGIPSTHIYNTIYLYLSDIFAATNLETILPNEVTIYRDYETIMALTYIFNEFSDIFNDTEEVVDVIKNKWMNISL